jgi:general stress protein CsbA
MTIGAAIVVATVLVLARYLRDFRQGLFNTLFALALAVATLGTGDREMTIGVAIVLATVLVLATYHPGFRRGVLVVLFAVAVAGASVGFLAMLEQDRRQNQEYAARDQLAGIAVPASAIQLSDVFMAGTPDLPSAALRGVVTNNSPELLRAIELEISVSDCNGDPSPGEQPCHVVGQVRRRTEDVNVPAGQARTFQIFPLGFGPLPVTGKPTSAMSRRFDYRITSIYSDRSVSQ